MGRSLALGILVAASATAWVAIPAAQTAATLTVGYLPATHDTLLFIAYDEGFFPTNVTVRLAQAYPNSGDILRDLSTQRLDIGIPGVAAPVNFISQGHSFTIVGGAAAQSAAVVVPEHQAAAFDKLDYRAKVRLLSGKKVGTVRQSTGDALFRKAVKDTNVKLDLREYADPNQLLSELRNQIIDAAVLWSPHMTRAETGTPKMRIVLWMREILPNHVCCRQVVHDSCLLTRRPAVVGYMSGLIRAMRFYRNPANRARVLAIAARWIPTATPAVLEQELFGNAATGEPPRTTLSVDIDQRGIVEYVTAMRDMQSIDQQRERAVLSKVDTTILRDAYRQLGLSAADAQTCVSTGLEGCLRAGVRWP